LQIRHFIRVLLHVNNGTSICIGLPIKVTPQISQSECDEYPQTNDDVDDNLLRAYEAVINQGDRLPKYMSRKKFLLRQQRVINNSHNNSIDDEDIIQHLFNSQYISIEKQVPPTSLLYPSDAENNSWRTKYEGILRHFLN
jgi:hypothetical protein